jgi:hypothetical protein
MSNPEEQGYDMKLLLFGFFLLMTIILFIFHSGVWFAESKIYSLPKVQRCI